MSISENTLGKMLSGLQQAQQRMTEKQKAGDYEPARTFTLDRAQVRQINEWLTTKVYPAAVAKQRGLKIRPELRDIYESCWEDGYPYMGAIGGGLGYTFYSTSIGDVIKVRYDYVDMELDVTDYDSF